MKLVGDSSEQEYITFPDTRSLQFMQNKQLEGKDKSELVFPVLCKYILPPKQIIIFVFTSPKENKQKTLNFEFQIRPVLLE
jgi:hypothetical protein